MATPAAIPALTLEQAKEGLNKALALLNEVCVITLSKNISTLYRIIHVYAIDMAAL